MKWRIFSFLFILISVGQLKAQVSEGGLPPSFGYASTLRSMPAVQQIPISFNVEDLLLVDEWNVANGSPLCVSTSIPVNLTMENAGTWMDLPGGERIWQLRIQAEGAIALMLYYKTFDIPEGGKLFIYNADKTQVLGAYTQQTNPRKDYFATEFVAGDDLVLEYVVAKSDDEARIEIEEIGYGYNHLSVKTNTDLRSGASSCEVNINCSEGAAWQKEKAGVCQTVQKIGTKSYICTGSLVNNTAEDFKPYVLMAQHCMESTSSSTGTVVSTSDEMKQWLFYFNYERLGCTDSSPAVSKTMTGCSKVASTPLDGGGDALLLLLDEEVPESYNVYYNGWDRTNTAASSGVNIHHPAGDYKKISTFTDKAVQTTWYSSSVTGAQYAHWDVTFAETENGHGVTEGGSSGSPLFNQNHLIVGTLSGGSSSCDDLSGRNLFGKLYYNWNKYSLADTARLDIWLDPESTGVETLKGLSRTTSKPQPTALNLSYSNKTVTLSWTAPESSESPTHYNIYRTNQLIGTSSSTTYADSELSIWGELIYSVTAEYADGSESDVLSGSIVVQEYKSPTDLTMTSSNGTVSLTWKAPVYSQTISWSANSPAYLLRSDVPVYFGHLWDPDDLTGIDTHQVTGVEFYASKDATYSLKLIQGSTTTNRQSVYTQSVPAQRMSGVITVDLETPLTIDASKYLLVSVYAYSDSGDVGTIACDEGPAIIGKGNLISEDGEEWYVLYNGEESEDDEETFDSNFYLGTIVTSSNGNVTKMLAAGSSAGLKVYDRAWKKSAFSSSSLRASELRSADFQYPATFPELTGYYVYRGAERLTASPVQSLSYTDNPTTEGTFVYGVSAVYSGEESDPVLSTETAVSNATIDPEEVSLTPTYFNESVRITNAHKVKRLDIYSISGRLIKEVAYPDEYIPTSDFSSGMYIFKLYLDDQIKTIRAIKK